jgi:hypothetical protein
LGTDTMVVYKSLLNGVSPFQHYRWPLPADGNPGDWVDAGTRKPVVCSWGVHGYLTRVQAERDTGNQVFEMEIEGEIAKDTEKATGQRGRLLRQLSGVVAVTLADVADAVAKNGSHSDALAAAAANMGVTLASVEKALPKDTFVVDEADNLVTLARYLRSASATLGDGFNRRIWALSGLPLLVEMKRAA